MEMRSNAILVSFARSSLETREILSPPAIRDGQANGVYYCNRSDIRPLARGAQCRKTRVMEYKA